MCKILRLKSASKEKSQVVQTVHHYLWVLMTDPRVIKILLSPFGMTGPLSLDSWSWGSSWIPLAVLGSALSADLTLEWRNHDPPCLDRGVHQIASLVLL